MKIKPLAFVLLLGSLLLSPVAAQATVLRVVTIQTDNLDAYVKDLAKGQALLKKIGSVQELRIWRARFAGTDAGTVVVSIEFPDMQAFAEDDKKTAADPEFQT